jgi:hypothetical protein
MLTDLELRYKNIVTDRFYQKIIVQLADELVLEKISCPLGVLLIIFESRPDALVQVFNAPSLFHLPFSNIT